MCTLPGRECVASLQILSKAVSLQVSATALPNVCNLLCNSELRSLACLFFNGCIAVHAYMPLAAVLQV